MGKARLPDRIPHGFGPVTVGLAAVILIWAWWSSDREFKGCFRIDADTELVIGHAGAEIRDKGATVDRAQVVGTRRVRGYLFTLDRPFYAEDSDPSAIFGAPGEAEGVITVLQNWGEQTHVAANTPEGRIIWPQVECGEEMH